MNRDERIERVFNTIAGIKNCYGQAAPALRLMAEAIVDDLPTLIEADIREQVAREIEDEADAVLPPMTEFIKGHWSGLRFASRIARGTRP